MKMNLFYFMISAALLLQAGLVAQPNQPNPEQSFRVNIQSVSPSNEGGYYDSSTSQPQVQVYYKQQGDNATPSSGMQNPPSTQVRTAQPYGDGSQTTPQSNVEWTLSILKPDAVKNKHIGDILSRFERSDLHIAAIKMLRLSPEEAAQFYNVHRERPFFADLVKYMSSGPVVVLVLEGDQAVSKNRQLMGATDPKKAEKGTIRADYAESITQNSVHGSDSPESAKQEIMFFFDPDEIYPRQ